MNTHDIDVELPPLLPHPRNQAAGKVWTEPEKEVIRRWGHAAIEADCKRRGEPVGYVMPTAIKQLKAGGNAIVGGVNQGGDIPLYLDPQPAEPVKVPNKSEGENYG